MNPGNLRKPSIFKQLIISLSFLTFSFVDKSFSIKIKQRAMSSSSSASQTTTTTTTTMPLQQEDLKLYDFLSVRDIDNIQKYFRRLKSSGLSYETFRSLLSSLGIVYTDGAFHNVCLKIDLDRDNVINWSEFVAYFILELQNDDNTKERLSIIPPIPKPANVLSTTQRSNILRILFMSDCDADADEADDNYVTIGCYGDVYIWSSNWKFQMILHAGKSC